MKVALREERKRAGLLQRELAETVGVLQPHIARWEAGTHIPAVDTAIRIARALGVPVERIWTP